MLDMAEMGMSTPKNSIPMQGAMGPFGYINMGGMFTLVKVRDVVSNDKDPGWYEHPEGTVASKVSKNELEAVLGNDF